MKKKITISVVLLLLLSLFSGIIYLNIVLLPVKIKGQLSKSLTEYLNYNVEIGKIRFNLVKGIVIQNIVVYDKIKDKENTILTVKEASFHILFLPLIKERKIIIPTINIRSPYLNIRYRQDNTFNFSKVFLPKPKPQSKPKIKLSFFTYRINILNAKGTFTDERQATKFSKTIQDLNIALGIGQLTKIGFSLNGKILTDKGGFSTLTLKGNYNFFSKEAVTKETIIGLIKVVSQPIY